VGRETWKVRLQEGETSIGHEYWFADGVHGDRSGRSASANKRGFGIIQVDGERSIEDLCEQTSNYFGL
jgi:hypothetical protein